MKKPTGISPKFEQIINAVWDNPKRAMLLGVIDNIAVTLCVFSLALRVAMLAVEKEIMRLVAELLVLAVSFVVVSVFRKIINMPRPYEIGNITRIDSSRKKGESFPSRHVFSAFIIATVIAPANVYLSVGVFIMGALLAVSRVLRGIHFVRDVVVGAVTGIFSGVIGHLILGFAGI